MVAFHPQSHTWTSVGHDPTTDANRPLHMICAYDGEGNRAMIVTVYQPAPRRWEDYRRRKR